MNLLNELLETLQKMKLKPLFEIVDTAGEVAKIILARMKKMHTSGYGGSAHQVDAVEETSSSAKFAIRDFGHWEVPEDEIDDGDFDFMRPNSATKKILNKLVIDIKTDYPGFKVEFDIGEKNWIYCEVKK